MSCLEITAADFSSSFALVQSGLNMKRTGLLPVFETQLKVAQELTLPSGSVSPRVAEREFRYVDKWRRVIQITANQRDASLTILHRKTHGLHAVT
jgi:hypothetical protein